MKRMTIDLQRKTPEASNPYDVKVRITCSCGQRLHFNSPVIREFKGCIDLTCAKCEHKYHMVLPEESNT